MERSALDLLELQLWEVRSGPLAEWAGELRGEAPQERVIAERKPVSVASEELGRAELSGFGYSEWPGGSEPGQVDAPPKPPEPSEQSNREAAGFCPSYLKVLVFSGEKGCLLAASVSSENTENKEAASFSPLAQTLFQEIGRYWGDSGLFTMAWPPLSGYRDEDPELFNRLWSRWWSEAFPKQSDTEFWVMAEEAERSVLEPLLGGETQPGSLGNMHWLPSLQALLENPMLKQALLSCLFSDA